MHACLCVCACACMPVCVCDHTQTHGKMRVGRKAGQEEERKVPSKQRVRQVLSLERKKRQ